jgi:hypothetical protein
MVVMVGERTTAFNNIHIFLQCTGSPKEYIHINALRTRRLIDATGAIGAFESYNRGAVTRRTAAGGVDAWQL